MKTSKTLLSVVLAVLTIGLASCNGGNATPTGSNSSATSQHQYAISYSGEAKSGNELSFILKVDGKTVNQSSVTYSTSAGDKATVNGNKITFSEAGTYTVTATYNGESSTMEVTIAEGEKIYTIAEVIAEADKGNTGAANLYAIQGKITASAGNSAYISDSTGGMYIYNWSINSDGSDTAIKNKKFVAGDNVQLKAFVTKSYGAWQFSNYSNSRVEGTSAVLLEKEVASMTPISLNEDSYKSLTATDHAKLYTFEAEYVSDAPTKAGAGKNGTSFYTKFRLGDTDISLYYDKYDTTLPASASTLKTFSKYKITAPMRWYDTDHVAQFAYCSDGTTITEIIEPLSVIYSGKTNVGKTLTLTTKASGTAVTEGVTYSITSGNEYATLDSTNGTLTLTGAGKVTVQSSYTNNGTTLTATRTITVSAALIYKSLAEVLSLDDKTEFYTEAYVVGMSPVSEGKYVYVYLGDGTNGFYLYNVNEALLSGISVGDLMRVEGKYSKSYFEGTDVDYVEKLADNTHNVQAATNLEYNSTNAAALASTDSGKKVTLTSAKVTAFSVNSSNNVDATLALGDVEYKVYLNNNYNESSVMDIAKTLKVGYDVTLTGFTGYYSSGKYTRIQTLSAITINESFYLDKTSAQISLANDDKTVQLTSGYYGTLTGDTVTWASSDSTVAAVSDSGLVTGLKVGTTTITATYGSLTATCEIEVVAKAVEKVSLEFNATNFTDAASFSSGETYEKAVTVGTHEITVKVEKGTYTSSISAGIKAIGSNSELRLYKGTVFTVTFKDETFTKVSFVDSSQKPFASPTKIITPANTITNNDVEFTSETNTFSLSGASDQIRVKSLTFSMSE